MKKNFNLPYFSRNIAEFWKRWHISLNTWFVDYVYIPLGGSRVSKAITVRNTFVIFLVSGLWHGANWTFVCWGLYHALLFVPLLLLGKQKKFGEFDNKIRFSMKEIGGIFCTFILVVFGWVLFRAETIGSDGAHPHMDVRIANIMCQLNLPHEDILWGCVGCAIRLWLLVYGKYSVEEDSKIKGLDTYGDFYDYYLGLLKAYRQRNFPDVVKPDWYVE